MTSKIIKRESLSKQVSDQLEKMISSGKYKLGEKIPTESELMEMFDVSRNTIREAIQSLTWSGLLVVKQGDGTYVSSSDRFNANMEQKYQTVSLESIKEARNCLELTIAHLAATRRNDDDLKNIKEKLQSRKALETNIKENTKADLDFHIAIALACHNSILIDMYKSIAIYLENQISDRNKNTSLPAEEIDKLHEILFTAILEGNPEKATDIDKKILEI